MGRWMEHSTEEAMHQNLQNTEDWSRGCPQLPGNINQNNETLKSNLALVLILKKCIFHVWSEIRIKNMKHKNLL